MVGNFIFMIYIETHNFFGLCLSAIYTIDIGQDLFRIGNRNAKVNFPI